LILFSHLEVKARIRIYRDSGALVHYQFRVVSSNKPSLIVSSQFCSITARRNGNRARIRFGQDPGQLGKSQPLHLVRALQAEQLRAEKGSS
jgi:hypothetical protein